MQSTDADGSATIVGADEAFAFKQIAVRGLSFYCHAPETRQDYSCQANSNSALLRELTNVNTVGAASAEEFVQARPPRLCFIFA